MNAALCTLFCAQSHIHDMRAACRFDECHSLTDLSGTESHSLNWTREAWGGGVGGTAVAVVRWRFRAGPASYPLSADSVSDLAQ